MINHVRTEREPRRSRRLEYFLRRRGIDVHRFSKFCITGLVGFCIQSLVTFTLTSGLHVYYMLSMTMGVGAAVLWTFTVNSKWTFKDRA